MSFGWLPVMTRVHFLPHQLYHYQSTSSDSSNISSISSDQSNNEELEESNYNADHVNGRAFFEDSNLEERFKHLGNSETNPLEITDDVDIFGLGDLLAWILRTEEEEKDVIRDWGGHFRKWGPYFIPFLIRLFGPYVIFFRHDNVFSRLFAYDFYLEDLSLFRLLCYKKKTKKST